MISMIVARAKNGVIGKDNKLLWHIPEDLKFFKQKTAGHIIIMGRKTLESLPGKLPEREHWVLTTNKEYSPKYEGVKLFTSMESILQELAGYQDEVFVIGGAQIYREFLSYADRLYITEIDETYAGDVSFPEITVDYSLVKQSEPCYHGKLKYQFTIWERS